MIVLRCNQPTFFDVDDTLVKWGSCPPEEIFTAIPITCPVGKVYDEDGNETESLKWTEYLRPHKKHIEQLKQHKLRGHTIIVWSQGGWEWANAVVKALELEKYVDLVMEKPCWIYDDIPASEFMPKNQWYKDEDKKETE